MRSAHRLARTRANPFLEYIKNKLSGSLLHARSSMKNELVQKAVGKVTRALYDSGADDHTTNEPFIIFKLHLLPREEWTTLYDAGKKPHVTRYGGESYLRMKSGKMKSIRMRFTPSMRIAAIDPSKLKDRDMVCASEGHVISHEDEKYYHVCQYSGGHVDMIPLQQYRVEDPLIERYYTEPFTRVTSETALKYISARSLPKIAASSGIAPDTDIQIQVRSKLNSETTQILWHARLAHIHDGAITQLHKLSDGIPYIAPRTSIDNCPTCMDTKLTKIRKYKSSFKSVDKIRKDPSVTFFQHLQIDVGIIVLK